MDKEGKKRLLKLATLLHDHSRGRQMKIPGDGMPAFDLWKWVDPKASCGTAACAVGCAMLSPWFQKQGLRTVKVKSVFGRKALVPGYLRKKSWGAVRAFFGIESDDASFLFSPFQYGDNPTPKQVAKRIRAFVASQEK